MSTRVDFEDAFILHRRPFKESSLMLDLFTRTEGRVSVIAKGAKRSKTRAGQQGLLQPFTPISISWQGKGELKTMVGIEPNGHPMHLSSLALVSGLYLNEILVKTLIIHDSYPKLFESYRKTVYDLSLSESGSFGIQAALRVFECDLLQSIGYAINFDEEAKTGENIDENLYYYYHPELGFYVEPMPETEIKIKGDAIVALRQRAFGNMAQVKQAKQVMRIALHKVLGDKPLNSRKLVHYTPE